MSDFYTLTRIIAYLGIASALGAAGCSGGGEEGPAPVDTPPSGAGTGGASGSAPTWPGGGGSGLGGAPGGGGGGSAGSSTPGAGGASGSAGGSATGTCIADLACNAAPPDPGPVREWVHNLISPAIAAFEPRHRGRDLFLNPGDQVWAIAKFAYGLNDKDLTDEDVDVYLARDCGDAWQKLGTVRTTDDGNEPPIEGVANTGGWVFFPVPAALGLGEGRHRFRFVMGGDLTATESFVEIVKPGTPVIVSDIDGTLTTSEFEEFTDLLTGDLPEVNEGAPALVNAWAARGYRRFYLTARPEWLMQRTRDFLRERGFPPGVVHTSLDFDGALGGAATTFKSEELARLVGKGLAPAFAVGNTETDAAAYANAAIQPLESRLFFQFTDTVFGGRRFESYTDLLGEAEALPDLCPN